MAEKKDRTPNNKSRQSRPRPPRPTRTPPTRGPRLSSVTKSVGLWLLIILLPLFLYRLLLPQKTEYAKVPYSEFLEELKEGNVASSRSPRRGSRASCAARTLTTVAGLRMAAGRSRRTGTSHADSLEDADGPGPRRPGSDDRDEGAFDGLVRGLPQPCCRGSSSSALGVSFGQLQGGGSKRSRSASHVRTLLRGPAEDPLEDVRGADEAKVELQEIIDSSKIQEVPAAGWPIPRARSCSGPRTGKTLLARAVAGEAACRSFSIGSDSSRVRRRGRRARARPLRAGQGERAVHHLRRRDRRRGAPPRRRPGRRPRRARATLNQLLVEMDGFERTRA